jgi:hypothetical protein
MHPWEDWAETWAHYLHMVDTLETAYDADFHLQSGGSQSDNEGDDFITSASFDALFDDWSALSVALNALNRSMGLEDAYPFVFSEVALMKLRYVHDLIKTHSHKV